MLRKILIDCRFQACESLSERDPPVKRTHLELHPLLEIQHLSIAYPSPSGAIHAVRDLSLQLFDGETLAIAGETGSGKSTLALAILGLLSREACIESGEILFEGHSIRSLGKHDWGNIRGRKIGIIFQDARSALNPVLTVEDHLVETIQAHQKLTGKEARSRASDLLHEVGIPKGHEKLYPFELSGGICQRVGIALAICNNPQLLIADEPTSAVDSTIQAQILDELQLMKQHRQIALFLISHDLAVISQVADRISVMYHGQIVESGLKEEVFAAPAHPYTQGLINCQPGLQHHHKTNPLAAIPGTAPSPGQNLAGCSFAPRCHYAEARCRQSGPVEKEISSTHRVACFCDINESNQDRGA
jgi:oligopeptide/dipeptide ABC transporter ATP-binding protein